MIKYYECISDCSVSRWLFHTARKDPAGLGNAHWRWNVVVASIILFLGNAKTPQRKATGSPAKVVISLKIVEYTDSKAVILYFNCGTNIACQV